MLRLLAVQWKIEVILNPKMISLMQPIDNFAIVSTKLEAQHKHEHEHEHEHEHGRH